MDTRYTIGRCSICGGEVKQYKILHIVGVFPPAECVQCGAVERRAAGVTIPMEPRPVQRYVTGAPLDFLANRFQNVS